MRARLGTGKTRNGTRLSAAILGFKYGGRLTDIQVSFVAETFKTPAFSSAAAMQSIINRTYLMLVAVAKMVIVMEVGMTLHLEA